MKLIKWLKRKAPKAPADNRSLIVDTGLIPGTFSGGRDVDMKVLLREIEQHLSKIASCVQHDHHRHGDRVSLSIKDWNA